MSKRLIITREWIDKQVSNNLRLPINHRAVKAAADRTCEVNNFTSFPIIFELEIESVDKGTISIDINLVDG